MSGDVGAAGRVLLVDLDAEHAEAVALPDSVRRAYIGGAGLGAWLLASHCPRGVDPLAPGAPLVLAFAPLAGAPDADDPRLAIVAKAPQTRLLGDALVAGPLARAGASSGLAAIVVAGARDTSSLLLVDGTDVRVEAAAELRGLSAANAERSIRARLGDDWQVLAIGPAGERLVRFATVAHRGRHAGRGGLGAVLGTKAIKAIAVRVGDEDDTAPSARRPKRAGRPRVARAFARCEVDDDDCVAEAIERCDALGLDSISAGETVAWAMECAERGLLDAPWLRRGDGNALLRALDEIGGREGVGDLLALGSRAAGDALGREAAALVRHVKGLELAPYEPERLRAMALGLAIGPRGGDHNRSGAHELGTRPTVEDEVAATIAAEDRAATIDSLIVSRSDARDLDAWATALGDATGWDVDADELRAAARRIVVARRAFNAREGWTRADDTLPSAVLAPPLTRDRLDALVARYYAARGLDPLGLPQASDVDDLRFARDSA